MPELLHEIRKGQVGHGLLVECDGYISLNDQHNITIKEAIEKESTDGSICPHPFIVNAIFQKYDVENANGRVYPEAILKREVSKYQKLIEDRAAMGQLDHPADAQISGKGVAMNIIELHWEGKTLVGKLEIVTSPGFRKYGIISCDGDKAANLLLNGLKIGVSSRAVGSVERSGGVLRVGDDLEILCWDIVVTPSTPGAYISNEEKELEQYKESKATDKTKTLLEKLSQYDDWLRK